jgi:nucleotide-binding universal stress UspA family protein
MVRVMRALVWITEDSWEATIAAAAELVPEAAEITLLHVTGGDAEALARGARSGLLGRGRGPEGPPELMRSISEDAARALLGDAATLLGRSAEQVALRGRAEQEVVAAAARADLLVLSRDGDPSRPGPKSVGHVARFVLDHVTCRVLLV